MQSIHSMHIRGGSIIAPVRWDPILSHVGESEESGKKLVMTSMAQHPLLRCASSNFISLHKGYESGSCRLEKNVQ